MAKTLPACDDAKMIRIPDLWPCWPFLPMKRRGRGDTTSNSLEHKTLGCMVATLEHANAVGGIAGSKFTIFHVYMYDAPKTAEAWNAAPRTEYSTIDEMLADGWMVD